MRDQPGRTTTIIAWSTAIVEAVIAHDADAAEQAMHAHLRSVIDAFNELGGADRAGRR